ncbi:MAG: hypothetical protein HQ595_02510, partial [Candidatus Omnitrophica bacterium]|nr:hypothetical protein [Candidatus Omnitrophota bacterium]
MLVLLIVGVYPTQSLSASQALQVRLADDVVLKVHLEPGSGDQEYSYARQVLQAASEAYREIVINQGFSRTGYSFTKPTGLFAYDADKVIDIYITDVEAPFALLTPVGGLEYQANIYVPQDYRAYRKRYKISQPELELKASLAHELLHIITFSYNRNMQINLQGKTSLTSHRWDWYTEGLARYFEALAGYREEFLSAGYRKDLGDKVLVYKGGVNYFLRYPDKPLEERKYDFALFWQYIHETFGMDEIEEISFKFRQVDPALCSNREAMEIIANTLGLSAVELWRDFSLYVYKASVLPLDQESGLKPVYVSKLSSRKTLRQTISSFGLDYYEVDLGKHSGPIQIDSHRDLTCQAGVASKNEFSLLPVEGNNSDYIKIDPPDLPQNEKLIIML